MSSNFLRRLRLVIIILSFSIGILLIAYYAYLLNLGFHGSLYWESTCQICITIVVFLTYIYAIRFKQVVPRFLRAFLLFAISILWLYMHFRDISLGIKYKDPYTCPSHDYLCGMARAMEVFSVACGLLILLEIAATLYHGPLDRPQVQQQDVVLVSPIQPMQQQYPQPYPGAYYQQQPLPQPYPGMQQPLQPLPQFQTQEQLHQRHRADLQKQPVDEYQPFYQPQPAPQQQFYQGQRPYSAPGYVTVAPPVPGTTITTTPQPGVPPLVPYPSPGTSVAVSPVIPVAGYSMA